MVDQYIRNSSHLFYSLVVACSGTQIWLVLVLVFIYNLGFIYCLDSLDFRMVAGRKTQAPIVNKSVPSSPNLATGSSVRRNLGKSHLGGVIFGCKNNTIKECLSGQLFGQSPAYFAYLAWYIFICLPCSFFNCTTMVTYILPFSRHHCIMFYRTSEARIFYKLQAINHNNLRTSWLLLPCQFIHFGSNYSGNSFFKFGRLTNAAFFICQEYWSWLATVPIQLQWQKTSWNLWGC